MTLSSSEKTSPSVASPASDWEPPNARAGIEWIDGATCGLIIAPHGVMGNDDNTGPLARQTALHANFHAAVNEVYRRPSHPSQADPEQLLVDLNRIDQVIHLLNESFLQPLLQLKEKIVEKHGRVLIVLIHGINDRNLQKYIRETGAPGDTAMLIGYGQGNDGQSRSAYPGLADNLIRLLKTNPIKGITARSTEESYDNYRGGHGNNLNQLFRRPDYRDELVQSLQLEITWTGYRDTSLNIENTARVLGWALRRMAEMDFDIN